VQPDQPVIQRTWNRLKIQTRAEFRRFIHRVKMLDLAPAIIVQVFLLQERKPEPSTVEIRISAPPFLYKRTLKRRDLAFDDLIFPKVPQKLPNMCPYRDPHLALAR